VPLFREKADCPRCGAAVKRPSEVDDYLCPHCGGPGPWASAEQRSAWEQAERDRQRISQEQERARLELRRRALQQAASLTPIQVPGFITQKAEQIYFAMPAKLAEWTKERGHYEGGAGIRGVSMKVPGTKSMRVYTGGLTQRRYVPGAEGWRFTEDGTAVITSKRIVFRGLTKAVEWNFQKLVGVDADRSNGCLVLQVSNRQKAHVLQLSDLELFSAALEAALRGTPAVLEEPAPALPPPPPPA
jgi:hypothetical protein